MQNLEANIRALEDRNRRVEKDKAWEVSFTRRGFIAGTTYVAALLFMALNGMQNAPLQALIPAGAYVLSTLSLPPLKSWWLKRKA